ncbi:hypothetical protein V8J88_00690 [Massilia sp. W12]|uniref:hypothetical protein n=1 Tax=Massilia sp. W12 TaxID=3126507 RepID=UPI0030CCE683
MKKTLLALTLTTLACSALAQAPAQESAAPSLAAPPPIPPVITMYSANPPYLQNPGNTTLYWNSVYAFYCNASGTPHGPSGSKTQYLRQTTVLPLSCYGQYGVTTAVIQVVVRNPRSNEGSAEISAASAPDLRHFGLHPHTEGQDYLRGDFDGDTQEDLLVLEQGQLHFIGGHAKNRSQKRSIAFHGDLSKLRSITIARDPNAAMQITTNW